MPRFSQASLAKLETCHPLLVELFSVVIRHYDCTVLQGWRSLADQARAVEAGASKVRVGRHNSQPSMAVDAAPYPVDWGHRQPGDSDSEARRRMQRALHRFYHFGGFVQASAIALDVPLRWGGDWDSDRDFTDQTFNDLVHFELPAIQPGGEVA